MSSRKRRRVPKTMRLRTRLIAYACFLVIPTTFGGACGVVQYLMPARQRFGEPVRLARSANDDQTATLRRCLTGAGAGAILGVGGAVVFGWATRPKKPKW